MKNFLINNIFSGKELQDLKHEVAEVGFSEIYNPDLQKIGQLAREEYFRVIDSCDIHSQEAKFDRQDLIKAPWRKTAVSGINGLGETISHMLSTTYFHYASPELKHLCLAASVLISLRNFLSDLPQNFGSNPSKEEFWNASRVHHYPCGGGYMQEHKDTYFPELMNKYTHFFVQTSMLMSNLGEHFEEGGLKLWLEDGAEKYVESACGIGKIVVFDGRRVSHGVVPVDAESTLSWHAQTGRLAMYANLYEAKKN